MNTKEEMLMASKQGKIWGTTEEVVSNASFEFHRLEFKKNSNCSIHRHQTKFNGFFVESGRMMIEVWEGADPYFEGDDLHGMGDPDKTFLTAGDYFEVLPGTYHRFTGIESGVAFEVYWSEYWSEDITRLTHGERWSDEDPEREESTPENNLNHDGE